MAAMMTQECKRHTYVYDILEMHVTGAPRACRHAITPQPNADRELSEVVLWASRAPRAHNTVRT